jgi:hypothetical protein
MTRVLVGEVGPGRVAGDHGDHQGCCPGWRWCHRPNATLPSSWSRAPCLSLRSSARDLLMACLWSRVRSAGAAVTLTRRYVLSNRCAAGPPERKAAEPAKRLVIAVDADPGGATVRPHPDKGSALQPINRPPNTEPTSVSAGQRMCGAPRRNRTGDPILTMDRGRTAVLTGVSAARATP